MKYILRFFRGGLDEGSVREVKGLIWTRAIFASTIIHPLRLILRLIETYFWHYEKLLNINQVTCEKP